jgi:uracil-DNA glycosylase
MTTYPFNLKAVHPSWHDCLQQALKKIDPQYLTDLKHIPDWLPGPQKIFQAFSIPLTQVNYVLFGESPYPRPESANGYAFWDAAVHELWSATGLDKKVNRATSLRNIIKMLLIAEGILDPKHITQADIARVNKTSLIKNNEQLFQNFLKHGFLLLNTTLVLQSGSTQKDARAWQPFMKTLLNTLLENPGSGFNFLNINLLERSSLKNK